MRYNMGIERDTAMAGADKQISHRWRSRSRTGIITLLVSEANGATRGSDVSKIG